MAVLARARPREIERLLAPRRRCPAYTRLRGPETGLVMLRGRAGGSGAPFNLGEMTVTRCTVRTEAAGSATPMSPGRDLRQAELAAALDAALQDPATRGGAARRR